MLTAVVPGTRFRFNCKIEPGALGGKTRVSQTVEVGGPLGPVMGPALGFPPNFGELISASHGATYWARHDKAVRELGYAPRSLEQGLRDTLEAEGKLPATA